MIFYAYFGYPLCLLTILFVKRLRGNTNAELNTQDHTLPKVSFIITAYNEEKRIKEKIDNSLLQDYPREKLEIIVASDCSSDKTDDIVKSFKSRAVDLVRAPERKGKENAQRYAVESSNGDILVFSDVATILESNGISNIVDNFHDRSVGCVSSEDRFVEKDGTISGEGAYVKYEMFLRKLESKVNTLVGLSGSFFAARREVCKNWAVDLQSDFNTLLSSIRLNLRGISDPKSTGYYQNIFDDKKEFDRKTSTVLRGLSVFIRNLSLLNPLQYGLFSWQLFSHKLCRWLVPFFMLLAFVSNAIILFESGFFVLTFVMQLIFYYLAFTYYIFQIKANSNHIRHTHSNKTRGSISIANFSATLFRLFLSVSYKISAYSKLPFFFVSVNTAILMAWWRLIKGERATYWEPSRR